MIEDMTCIIVEECISLFCKVFRICDIEIVLYLKFSSKDAFVVICIQVKISAPKKFKLSK